MKLGAKIGGGFAVLILIALILGGIAVWQMHNVQGQMETVTDNSGRIKDAAVPMAAVANRVERSSFQTMYSIRGYGYTESAEFLAEGQTYLKEVNAALNDAATLAEKMNIPSLRDNTISAQKGVAEYSALVARTEKIIATLNECRTLLDSSGGVYMKMCDDYLSAQEKALYEDMEKKDITTAALVERYNKTKSANELIGIGNMIIRATWRAQAERSPQLIIDRVDKPELFKKIAATLSDMKKITRNEANLRQIDDCQKATNEYAAALAKLVKTWTELQEIGEMRNKVGGNVLSEGMSTTKAGFAEADKMAQQTVTEVASANGALTMSTWVMVIGLLVALIVGIVLALWITRSIVGPIQKVCAIVNNEICQGDFTQRLNHNSKDEIGEMCVSLDRMSGGMEEKARVAQTIANGDLTMNVDLASDRDVLGKAMSMMSQSLNNLLTQVKSRSQVLGSSSEELSAISTQLVKGSEEMTAQAVSVASATEQTSHNIGAMAAAAEEMSSSVTTVSAAAEQMSRNMNAVASSIEEMNSTIGDVTRNAQNGAAVAEQAAKMGHAATETMNKLGAAAREIGKVTQVIKRIAEQTNLLALNATIEAASAGEAGKGFAVVANEIKELANQSAQAAEDIANKIDGVQGNTTEAVKVIGEVSSIINNIADAVNTITTAVEQQSKAANEIATNVGETNKGINNVASSITEVSRSATEVSKNAGEAARAANEMARNIGGVSQAARDTNSGAGQVSLSSQELAKVAGEMQAMVSQFKIRSA